MKHSHFKESRTICVQKGCRKTKHMNMISDKRLCLVLPYAEFNLLIFYHCKHLLKSTLFWLAMSRFYTLPFLLSFQMFGSLQHFIPNFSFCCSELVNVSFSHSYIILCLIPVFSTPCLFLLACAGINNPSPFYFNILDSL